MRTENWLNETIKEYGSLEKYIANMDENGADPLVYGDTPFRYLFEKGLLKEFDIIRTNLEGGFRDGHYSINSKGELEGIELEGGAAMYSGDPGIYSPEKILSLEKADNGWTLGIFAKCRIIHSIEEI
ncbi:MAG: hypothetical protein Q7S33_04560 [Nanoarchaeota archaeon]|nr:hypothetical protein [Nanoarchaeota archaeon]